MTGLAPDMSTYTEAERLELRAHVRVAGEITGSYWPMRTFIHHNPLHGLEQLPFHDAVQRANQLLRGRGYLANETYRAYFGQGTISPRHVEAVLRPLAQDGSVTWGAKKISHVDVLRAHFLHGLGLPAQECPETLLAQSSEPERVLITILAAALRDAIRHTSAEAGARARVDEELAGLGRITTLAGWCDQTLDTQLTDLINGELSKWCAAFLDEGQAAWPMPHRDATFYGTWKTLAQMEPNGFRWGISDWQRKVAALPERPEDALLESLRLLGIPREIWQDYFALHLGALVGWSGFIRWRSEQQGYAWQETYPVSLVKYLAIRLFYERELVALQCRRALGIDGAFPAIRDYMHWHPLAYVLRRERVVGRLPDPYARDVARLALTPGASADEWDTLAQRYLRKTADTARQAAGVLAAWQLVRLAHALEIDPAVLRTVPPTELRRVLEWLRMFPEAQHGLYWLRASEATWQDRVVGQLLPNVRNGAALAGPRTSDDASQEPSTPRPQAQAVFCIDVRSEVFRRHLETIGNYETFGFAGFFICFVRYRSFGAQHDTDQYPVIMKARNLIREIPRSYQERALDRHRVGTRIIRGLHALLHDLKEHVITPYVMVESLGWFYAVPFFGKTVAPLWFQRGADWLKRLVAPPVSTTLTVDKLTKEEAEEMVAGEQRAAIRHALRSRLGLPVGSITAELVEALRLRALNGDGATEPAIGAPLRVPGLSAEEEEAFVLDLRRVHRVDRRWAAAEKERITRTGFTLDEQVFTVETALRMMGLTTGFSRFVVLFGHGSTSDNNPYESALDCGACGGNQGAPNARLLAAMANRPRVRERLAKNGIAIPPDTQFVAAQIDTTTDEVEFFDLEDVPPTHRKDLTRIVADLQEASRLTSLERCRRFPDASAALFEQRAVRAVRRRSADWSQVRPEWGLSRNAAFIIARRALTQGLDLEGRVFLHSYDYLEDPAGKLLEVLLTAPQVVTQWINMEHYFSTVDNDVYGAGSKVYHNVVGRVGVMFGTQSDLRIGLPWQTVMDGEQPYHEPMRLLTIVEAPRARVEGLIQRHDVLKRFYHHEWVHLMVLEREERRLYRYRPAGGWQDIDTDGALVN